MELRENEDLLTATAVSLTQSLFSRIMSFCEIFSPNHLHPSEVQASNEEWLSLTSCKGLCVCVYFLSRTITSEEPKFRLDGSREGQSHVSVMYVF